MTTLLYMHIAVLGIYLGVLFTHIRSYFLLDAGYPYHAPEYSVSQTTYIRTALLILSVMTALYLGDAHDSLLGIIAFCLLLLSIVGRVALSVYMANRGVIRFECPIQIFALWGLMGTFLFFASNYG